MVRVVLDTDYGKRIKMCFGYPVSIPMQFGSIDPSVTVGFRDDPMRVPVEPNTWWLDFASSDERMTTMPEEAAVCYFGDPRASGADNELVKARKIPRYNDERMRVAQVWGDYLYSDQHGNYTTVRIKVPNVPHVSVYKLDHNMQVLPEQAPYRPWEFFLFEELLDPAWEAELAALHARKPKFAPREPEKLDISNLTEEQIDQLAKMLSNRNRKAG